MGEAKPITSAAITSSVTNASSRASVLRGCSLMFLSLGLSMTRHTRYDLSTSGPYKSVVAMSSHEANKWQRQVTTGPSRRMGAKSAMMPPTIVNETKETCAFL
eukprot:scaffold436_cov62-Phaeocystis_antarctica.AAC.7